MSDIQQQSQFQPEDFFQSYCQYCQRLDLLDMLNDAVTIVHAETGNVLFMNEKACRMYRYSAEEFEQLHVTDLADDVPQAVLAKEAEIKAAGENGLVYTAHHRRKNGEIMTVEVNSRALQLHGTPIIASLVRDVSASRQVQNDVQLAAAIQRSFLSQDQVQDWFVARTLYFPKNLVSGDLFNYVWLPEKNRITGYILDIMGHGMATALQATALHVLIGQTLNNDLALADKLHVLNSQAAAFFAEDSFAAALLFTIDQETRTLTYASAGINHFLISEDGQVQTILAPGCFLGVAAEMAFEENTIPLRPGQSVYFLTDGLMELLPSPRQMPGDFDAMVDYLTAQAQDMRRHDDASALCLLMK